MARVYVVLDLETTGLDAEKDRIIEVGAIRFRGSHVFDEFHSLVNPGRPVPLQIEHLTGISTADVQDAPPFDAIRARLERFVGDNPIIGHNVRFDLGFLQAYGLFHRHASIDTFEMASILLPYADRYSLHALAKLLEIPDPPTHRALDDVRVTMQLFEALQDQARRLDSQVLEDVARLGARSRWSLTPVFQDLARERSGLTNPLAQQLSQPEKGGLRIAPVSETTLRPVTPPNPIDVDAVAGLLEPAGLFEQTFDHFEHRRQQVTMLRQVSDALNYGYHLLVEAGTGTGKSLAYLIPALYWAVQNQSRVVISTNTINLQDQILSKDLPDLKSILNLDFNAVALKGRGNYVCPRRVEQLRQKANLSPAELRMLAKITIWLPNTLTGDKQELFMPDPAEQASWSQVNANAELCPIDRCRPDTCFFARARKAAESAHIIVVNHALLLADIAVNNRAIPEYDYLIIDESHHLEDSVTRQLSFSASRESINQLLGELSSGRGNIFNEVAQRLQGTDQIFVAQQAQGVGQRGIDAANQVQQAIARVFDVLSQFMQRQFGGRRAPYDQRLRITKGLRNQAAWSNVELAWDDANLSLSDALQALQQLQRIWDDVDSLEVDSWENVAQRLAGYRVQVEELKQKLNQILSEDNAETVTWIAQQSNSNDIALHAAPLHVGNLVREHLFESKTSVILTSATMRTDNSFEYLRERLGAWDAEELAVGSPFDYRNNTLLYIPTDLPEPNAPGFQRTFSQALVNLAIATRGRMLVLFTSYSHLRQTAREIQPALTEHDIPVYQQGAGIGRRQLLDNFKAADKAVLMGTRSFWEGIDVPGKDLSCVVIAKIPFAVPSDPIFQARSETFDNAFAQYSIPEAVLHFRQGFGRLIRTRNDLGVVVIMDKRVLSKSYGRVFIDSLPETTVRQGLLADLPTLAAEWIDADV